MAMLLHAFVGEPDCIHRLCAGGRPGSPVVFPASCFTALRSPEGDEGGRALIRRSILPVRAHEVTDPLELMDVDRPGDLEKILERMDRRRSFGYNDSSGRRLPAGKRN